MDLDAFVFDAYGTLFDVHSVTTRCEAFWPTKGSAASQMWRSKQLEYTWLRSLMGTYEPFESVTADALRFTCNALGLELDDGRLSQLLEVYRHLAPFPDASAIVASLPTKRAILSNGSPEMLNAVVRNNGMAASMDAILSVDALKIYKPDPRVYQLAVEALNLPAERIGFVSSNCWDACGAKSFGFKTFWINRTRLPLDRLGAEPDHILTSLADLGSFLA
jgi:2-haloacid dehalogenase